MSGDKGVTMVFWFGVIIFVLCVVVFALTVKVCLMRKAAREIEKAFADRVETDTNTLIEIGRAHV